MSNQIVKVVNNFMDLESRSKAMSFFDNALLNNPEIIMYGPKDVNKLGPVIQVGDDQDFPQSHKTFASIFSKEHTDENLKLSNQIIDVIHNEFNEERDVYLSSFWYRKQFSGSKISPHKDCNPEINWHFEYSAIIYLNDFIGGELVFNDLGFSIKPEAGDLIVFNTKDVGIHEVKELNDIRYSMPMWFTFDEKFALKG